MNIKRILAGATVLALGLVAVVPHGQTPSAPAATPLSPVTTIARTHEAPLIQARAAVTLLRHLPDGGHIESLGAHWWVQFTQQPAPGVFKVLASLGANWGVSVTPVIAPGQDAHLNPATMSTAALMRAGLPLPASKPGTPAYRQWLATVTTLLPKVSVSLKQANPNTVPGAWYVSTEQYNPIWAGYEDVNNTYTGLQSQWDMAQVASSLPKGDGVSQWIGLGGDSANTPNIPVSIVQAGAAYANPGVTTGNMWIQAYYFPAGDPNYGTTEQSCYNYQPAAFFGTVHPGDNMWAQIWQEGQPTINGVTYTDFKAVVVNVTTGADLGWQTFNCAGTFNDNSADAILETPTLNISGQDTTAHLPPFSTPAPFFHDYTYVSAGEVNGQVAPYKLIQLWAPSVPVSAGNSATTTGWTSETSFAVANDNGAQP